MTDDDYHDAFDEELFTDWGVIKPGHVISALSERLRYRCGNSPRNWSGAGSTKYLPRDWQMMCGSFRDIFTARSFGGFEVTMPVPFADNPLFLCTVTATLPGFKEVSQLQAVVVNPEKIEVYWWSVDNLTRIYINWLAIGPVGIA